MAIIFLPREDLFSLLSSLTVSFLGCNNVSVLPNFDVDTFLPNLRFGAWAFVRTQNINKIFHRATNTTLSSIAQRSHRDSKKVPTTAGLSLRSE